MTAVTIILTTKVWRAKLWNK